MTPLLALTLLAATWTVDDDVFADFPSIDAAIQSPLVVDGDILQVRAGNYGPFLLTKSLTITGPAGTGTASVGGTSVISVPGGGSIANLKLLALRVTNVPARVRVASCEIGANGTADPALDIEGCAQVVVARTNVSGRWAEADSDLQHAGVRVDASRVVFLDGSIVGGHGAGATCPGCRGGDGGPGLVATNGSDVVLVGNPSIRGGAAGYGWCGFGAPTCLLDGSGGNGVEAVGSTVRMRGTAGDVIGTGDYEPPWGGTPGAAVVAVNATLTSSGVTFDGAIVPTGSSLVTPPAVEPFVEWTGKVAPSSTPQLLVQGPAGAPVLLLFSISPWISPLPGLEGPLWIDWTAPLAAVATTCPGTLSVPLPIPFGAEWVGVSATVQTVFPTVPGTLDPTSTFVPNPVPLVVGW